MQAMNTAKMGLVTSGMLPHFFKQMVNSRVIETILLCIISVEIGASFPNTTIRASPQ